MENNTKISLCENLAISPEGKLLFAGRDTTELAEKYGTPLYLVDENRLRNNIRVYKTAMKEYYSEDSYPLYASKAMSFKQAYRIAAQEGIGADVVSIGELYTAYEAGFPMEKVFFHGNNKTYEDVQFAISKGIGYFVADNFDELDSIESVAAENGTVQKVLLRITPGIDPHTFEAVNTGKVDSKFGSAIETGQAREITEYALSKKHIKLSGFHCHIGSQIFDSKPFCDAVKIMLNFMKDMKTEFGFETDILNLGGGFGVPYVDEDPQPDNRLMISEISKVAKEICGELGIKFPIILHEPGRSICADAGLTLYTAGNIKEIPGFKNYVAIDGGMGDNPRYALYSSKYTVFVANKASNPRDYKCSVAGKCCESGDMIAENIDLMKPEKGDIIAVCTTGAYNYSMSSNYNRIGRPPVVMLKDGTDFVAVKRETLEDIVRNDI